jgi:hypothetical protein
MNILITGQLRESEQFVEEFLKKVSEKYLTVIKKVVIVTWENQETEEIEKVLRNFSAYKIIKINYRIGDFRQKSTFFLQKRLFDLGLKEFKENDIVFKIRTDLFIDFKLIEYLSCQREIVNGSKIWIPSYSPEGFGMFADTTFCGKKKLLNHVYKPSGLSFLSRSSNGMKCHLDTWSGYLFFKEPKLLDFINWTSSFFSIQKSLKFFLISKDLHTGESKILLWRIRCEVLERFDEFLLLAANYNRSIGRIFLIGSPEGIQNPYLRRLGPHFHSTSIYMKGSGNRLSETLESQDSSFQSTGNLTELVGKHLEIMDLLKNEFKVRSGSQKYWVKDIRLVGRPTYNYFKSVLKTLLNRNF